MTHENILHVRFIHYCRFSFTNVADTESFRNTSRFALTNVLKQDSNNETITKTNSDVAWTLMTLGLKINNIVSFHMRADFDIEKCVYLCQK